MRRARRVTHDFPQICWSGSSHGDTFPGLRSGSRRPRPRGMKGARVMVRGWVALVAMLLASALASVPAAAEVFAVPDSVRRMTTPFEETHILRAPDESVLGEQRSRAVVEGDKLVVDCWTKFTTGENWDERAVLN